MEGKKTFNQVFRNTFGTADGKTMLWWILDQCGCFQADPRLVSPDLVAFANRLLTKGGVYDPAQAGNLMTHIITVASQHTERSREDEDILED